MQALGEVWPGKGQAAHARGDFRRREAEAHAGAFDQDRETEEREQGPRLETEGKKVERGLTAPEKLKQGMARKVGCSTHGMNWDPWV